MRKFFLFMALCLTTVFAAKAADEIYAVWDAATNTLTLRYDGNQTANSGVTDWSVYKDDATKVVLDASMKDARPGGTACWFQNFKKLTEIEHLDYLNTSKVTAMGFMFYNCKELTSLDLSQFNTAQVKTMYFMFDGCESLTSLDVSKFNTQKATTMENMFYNCESLTSLDLSKFNTENVTDMQAMFRGCKSLTSIDLSNFSTSKVTNMNSMFSDCKSLTSLDLSKFTTSEVTNMGWMFSSCESLTSLDLGSFNTDKVEVMRSMFSGCKSLTSLDISKFNTEKVTNMGWMFSFCKSLTSLDLSSFKTEKVTDMERMFNYCPALTTLYWNEDLSERTGLASENMFKDCTSLKGSKDTECDGTTNIDKSYARPDKVGNPGYFTMKLGLQTKEFTPTVGTLTWNSATEKWMLQGYDSGMGEIMFQIVISGSKAAPTSITLTDANDPNNIIYVVDLDIINTVVKEANITLSYSSFVLNEGVVYGKMSGTITDVDGNKLIIDEPASDIEIFVNGVSEDVFTGIDQITNDQSPITNKIIKDNQLLILRDGKMYNVMGVEVK